MRRIIGIVVIMGFLLSFTARADLFKIEISNPKHKPIGIGLWGFVKNTEPDISGRFLTALKRDLRISGLFSWDESQHFSYDAPFNVVNGIAKMDNLNYVIYGDAHAEGRSIYVNIRITDVMRGSVVLDKTYTTNSYSLGWLANRVVDELIGYITGEYGPFESKIAFAMGNGRISDIYVCDFNGKNLVRITNWHSFNILPKWVSEDALTFLSYRYGKPALFLFNVFSGRLTKLFSNSNLSISAVRYMGYFAIPFNRYGSVNIYVVNGRGRVLKKLTNDPSINVSPSFTPDFSKMVFVSNRDGNPQIYIKGLNPQTQPQRLTFSGKYNSSPSVSPDGKKIAYISIDNGTTYLKVMNIDGSNDRVIMKGNSLDSPSWAYDSRYVALTGRIGNKNAIFIVNTINGNYAVAIESKLIYNGLSVSSKLQ
ncbi:TolB family protein [Hippea sp. KM1]|uniref:TolB family protein n=1 Tax=Hippea sp. KM1 TaxID=944481 RepID=UPI00046D3087|nr:TolB family protein [Hippea sp. KM1]